jgi:hypothetical protein
MGGVNLFSLVIVLETGDISPFFKFASSRANANIDWLEVTFRVDRLAGELAKVPHS